MRKIRPYLFFIAIFIFSLRTMKDVDFGWHLRVGEYILNNRAIPKYDLFSFTLPAYPYVYHSWLGEALAFLVYKYGGLIGVSIIFGLALSSAIFFIYKSTKLVTRGRASYFILLWSTLIFHALAGGRMRVFGLVFLAILYFLFLDYRINRKLKSLWVIPILFLFWSNFHGSFVLGIGVLFLLFFLDFIFSHSVAILLERKRLLIIIFSSLVATLINPYGFKVWTQSIRIFFNSVFHLQAINIDWQPLGAELYGLILPLIVITTLVCAKVLKVKIDRFQLWLSLIFLALSILLARFAFALFVFFLPLGMALTSEIIKKLDHKLTGGFSVRLALFIASAVLFSTVFGNMWELGANFSRKDYSQFINSSYKDIYEGGLWPYSAVEYLKKNNLTGKRLLVDANAAGFIIFQIPGQKVFYYGAMDNYIYEGESFAFEYLDLINARGDWREKLDFYDVEAVLLPTNYGLSGEISKLSNWRQVYLDDSSVIFVKS